MRMLTRCGLTLASMYGRWMPIDRGGFHLARAVRGTMKPAEWKGVFRAPSGVVMELDLGVYPDVSMAFGLYEFTTVRLLRRLLRPGSFFVDVGANCGYYTILATKIVGVDGRVDAFEPEPRNYARLQANLRLNGEFTQVRVHEVALADAQNDATVFTPLSGPEAGNHGVPSLFRGTAGEYRESRVRTERLDAVLSEKQPDVVKIDVEGAEHLVIKGMSRILQHESPPAIIMEYNPSLEVAAHRPPIEAVQLLLALQPKYRMSNVDSPHRLVSIDRLMLMTRPCNLLFHCPNA